MRAAERQLTTCRLHWRPVFQGRGTMKRKFATFVGLLVAIAGFSLAQLAAAQPTGCTFSLTPPSTRGKAAIVLSLPYSGGDVDLQLSGCNFPASTVTFTSTRGLTASSLISFTLDASGIPINPMNAFGMIVTEPPNTSSTSITDNWTAQVCGIFSDVGELCTTLPIQTVSIAVPPPSGCSVSSSPPSLPLGGGSITLNAACSGGGNPTTFAWSGPGVSTSTSSASLSLASVKATSTFTVIASNGSGAATAASVTVPVSTLQPPTRCAVTSTPASLPVGGGSVELTATCIGGGAPSTFQWSGPG